MNVIDVVAIVPFYIELGTSGSGSSIAIVRVLRLARMLRIFKASKYNEGTKLLSQTILRSLPVLSLLFFFTALGVVLFGSLIFFMEGGKYEVTEEYPNGAYMRSNLIGIQEVTPYTSIPVACYWVVVTATTVGFGDLYPTSGGGRLVACFCMYIGLLVLALPITVVGSNFTMVYEVRIVAGCCYFIPIRLTATTPAYRLPPLPLLLQCMYITSSALPVYHLYMC